MYSEVSLTVRWVFIKTTFSGIIALLLLVNTFWMNEVSKFIKNDVPHNVVCFIFMSDKPRKLDLDQLRKRIAYIQCPNKHLCMEKSLFFSKVRQTRESNVIAF